MITIESKYDYPSSLIERAVNAALAHQKESLDVNLSVVLTDNRRLHKLNRDYLGVDAPTDVLSFPASESDPETGARYIGDILISVPYAAKGAKLAGNSLEAELQLLVVHGVLHLLGHDHAKPKERSKMWKAQAEILEVLGLDDVKIREE
jgi:probable rRNA maturation factor